MHKEELDELYTQGVYITGFSLINANSDVKNHVDQMFDGAQEVDNDLGDVFVELDGVTYELQNGPRANHVFTVEITEKGSNKAIEKFIDQLLSMQDDLIYVESSFISNAPVDTVVSLYAGEEIIERHIVRDPVHKLVDWGIALFNHKQSVNDENMPITMQSLLIDTDLTVSKERSKSALEKVLRRYRSTGDDPAN